MVMMEGRTRVLITPSGHIAHRIMVEDVTTAHIVDIIVPAVGPTAGSSSTSLPECDIDWELSDLANHTVPGYDGHRHIFDVHNDFLAAHCRVINAPEDMIDNWEMYDPLLSPWPGDVVEKARQADERAWYLRRLLLAEDAMPQPHKNDVTTAAALRILTERARAEFDALHAEIMAFKAAWVEPVPSWGCEP